MSVRPNIALDHPNRAAMLTEDGTQLNRIAKGIMDLMVIACVAELPDEKAVKEFYLRINMYLQIWPDLWLDTETPFTLDLARKHMGLFINDETQSKSYFARHIANILREAAERAYRVEFDRANAALPPASLTQQAV